MADTDTSRSSRRVSPPTGSENWLTPWVQLRSATYHPFVYERMVGSRSQDAERGQLLHVYDKGGERFGMGFYNPRSRIALRMVCYGETVADSAFFEESFRRAVELREKTLFLSEITNAYRLFHGEGDGVSGLVVDRYDDVLSVEFFSYAAYLQRAEWIAALQQLTGTSKCVLRVADVVLRREGFRLQEGDLDSAVKSVRIREHGVRYAVDFERGHKTGFFCDQRENRRRFAELVEGQRVLDVCCYTGGFGLAALVHGRAKDVTGVDLDEKAIDQARHNANLNQVRARWVHTDGFSYLRQMQQNECKWDAVVLDPSKFIADRDSREEGRKKYQDLNRLAVSVVEPGGLFVTCSCSGLLSEAEFREAVIFAAHRQRRRLQIFDITGAGPDHPVMSNFPEGRYLKVMWCRVW